IIILDSMMPRMDGSEVLKHLKADQSTASIPVMMLTGRTHLRSIEKALELGADDYLAKPADADKLLNRVEKMLEKSDQMKEEEARRLGKRSPRDIKLPVIRPAKRGHLNLSDPKKD